MKRRCTLFAVLIVVILLSGCSSLLYKDYESIQEYIPAAQEKSDDEGKINVRNFAALKQALLDFVYAGDNEGIVVFEQSYEGEITEDLASACWQVRTQDALCAYCVENIAYEINHIVTISEAKIYISFSEKSDSADKIKRLSFSTGLENLIKEALEKGDRRLAVLVSRSQYNAEDVESSVISVYRQNPTLIPREPFVNVNMYSGTGAQRLYEININYGMTQDELEQRTAQLRAIDAFASVDLENTSEVMRAYMACKYLTENCTVSDSDSDNTAYSALINNSADSEGIALAYVVLCRQLKMDCRIVYGQRYWSDYCWNIIKVGEFYYHVDAARAITSGLEGSFLQGDESFWGSYRWDVASYPKCIGPLKYADILPLINSYQEESAPEADVGE